MGKSSVFENPCGEGLKIARSEVYGLSATWRDRLTVYRSRAKLERTPWFRTCRSEIDFWLHYAEHAGRRTPPRTQGFVRVMSWNIERGKRLGDILNLLERDPDLSLADVILLTEADVGMARSGNVHVARAIADKLGMEYVFANAFIELSKGMFDERLANEDNTAALHGIAVLSRYPILRYQALRLPRLHDFLSDRFEQRLGERAALFCDVLINGRVWTVGTAHLELYSNPRTRRGQVEVLLDELGRFVPAREWDTRPILLGGDFNTTTLALDHPIGYVRTLFPLLYGEPMRQHRRLTHPIPHEPLFRTMQSAGFDFENVNEAGKVSTPIPIRLIEQARGRTLPPPVVRRIAKRLVLFGGAIPFNLDWFFARRLVSISSGPLCEKLNCDGPLPPRLWRRDHWDRWPSDHAPILVDLTP